MSKTTTRQRLGFTMEYLPRAFPRSASIIHYVTAIEELNKLAHKYRHLSDGPKPWFEHTLVTPDMPVWMQIGHGPYFTVVEVLSHGDEPFKLASIVRQVKFLMENDWLLEDRAIILLFTNVSESMRNTAGWAALDSLASIGGRQGAKSRDLTTALTRHYRLIDDWRSAGWSWPLSDTLRFSLASLFGSFIMEVVKKSGMLVLWDTGHNAFIGSGVQFHLSGPHAAKIAQWVESLTKLDRIQIPIDLGPPESPFQARHPGTLGCYEFPRGEDLRVLLGDPSHGGSAFDWGAANGHELMSILACEVGMYRPWDKRMTHWQGMTRHQAEQLALECARYIGPTLKPVIALAQDLDPCDPTVAALQVLGPIVRSWDERARAIGSLQNPDEVLHPHHAFQISCAQPLDFGRLGGAGVAFLETHVLHWRGQILPRPPETMHEHLKAAIKIAGEMWDGIVGRRRESPALALQALASECFTLREIEAREGGM